MPIESSCLLSRVAVAVVELAELFWSVCSVSSSTWVSWLARALVLSVLVSCSVCGTSEMLLDLAGVMFV